MPCYTDYRLQSTNSGEVILMKYRKRDRGWPGMTAVALALLLMVGLFLTGCGNNPNNASPGNQKAGAPENSNTPDISSQPTQEKESVTLYFGDQEAMYLLPETRTVDKKDGILEAAVVEELVKGPQEEGSVRTIPEGTRVLSVNVVNGVAYVNFSKEFQTKHWGGSAGEIMTIYSVVNTLTELPGVEKVQFLLEGEKLESILGHMDTTIPIEPDPNLIED
jgi:spore germination protein GerM